MSFTHRFKGSRVPAGCDQSRSPEPSRWNRREWGETGSAAAPGQGGSAVLKTTHDMVVLPMRLQTPSAPPAPPLGTLRSVQWLAASICLCICLRLRQGLFRDNQNRLLPDAPGLPGTKPSTKGYTCFQTSGRGKPFINGSGCEHTGTGLNLVSGSLGALSRCHRH